MVYTGFECILERLPSSYLGIHVIDVPAVDLIADFGNDSDLSPLIWEEPLPYFLQSAPRPDLRLEIHKLWRHIET